MIPRIHVKAFWITLFFLCVFTVRTMAEPVPRGNRILAIAVNETEKIDYESALLTARATGLTAVSMPYAWDDLEEKAGVYAPDPNFLAIANAYYPGSGLKLALGINPIDTNNLRVPEDLAGRRFDDPIVIDRFKKLLDYVFSQIPNLELSSLTIGNEIDGTLLSKEEWLAYEHFFKEVAEYARRKRPGLIVGTKGMLIGVTGLHRKAFHSINKHADAVMVTYYPLKSDFSVYHPSVIHAEFKKLVKLYPGRVIYVMEIGYPSGEGLGSSEQHQVEFIKSVFKMWDRYADQIKFMEFTWLHDQPVIQLNIWEQYYGISDANFREFLGTLGLRHANGRDKKAFRQLIFEAKARGW